MKKEQTQTKRNHQSKEEEATRQETKRKKQQAQTERSHRRKEEEATRNRFMGGFVRKIQETRRRQGNKTQAPTPKEQKATPSRGLQGSDTKSTCEGFHTKPLYGRFCDGKNESKLKWKRTNSNKTQSPIKRRRSHTKEAKMKEQQAQAKRSPKKPHEIALWGGFREEKKKGQEEGKGRKRSTNTKRTESHTKRN